MFYRLREIRTDLILSAVLFLAFVCAGSASRAQEAEDLGGADIEYAAGNASLEGFLAFSPGTKTSSPGILIVPDWMGVSEFDRSKARELARNGYAVLVADVYGKGVRPKDAAEAGALAGKYKADRALLRERMKAALSTLSRFPGVDAKRIAVMGYCFGGTAALELARSGAQLAATVSFHGGLSTPKPEDAKNIKSPVLVLHGADDPFVPPSEVKAFEKEMKDADVSMTLVEYPGAVHAFTHPSAGNDNSKGAAYNAKADKESWAEFLKFIDGALRD